MEHPQADCLCKKGVTSITQLNIWWQAVRVTYGQNDIFRCVLLRWGKPLPKYLFAFQLERRFAALLCSEVTRHQKCLLNLNYWDMIWLFWWRILVTADQAGQSDFWSWFRAPSETPDQMFISLTFRFLSLLGVIPTGMTVCVLFLFL
jgi:hypothetical protein